MAQMHLAAGARHAAAADVNRIGAEDLRWALRSGWEDFLAKRGDLLFVPFLYPLIGLIVAAAALNSALLPLLFPMAAGLSIFGPVAAAGFYEIARRREQGDEAGWAHFLDPLAPDRRAGLVSITGLLGVLFLAWLLVAWVLYQLTLGRLEPVGIGGFVRALLFTPEGWTLIVAGNAAGAVIAAVTLMLTVVSVPMVVDRPVVAGDAVRTSFARCRPIRGRWRAAA
ncbi:DUF2189 domain-containing protein [Sphingomonas aracearum]|uniref:DUF2189 domain-containing protein n=1 Tax=Sphingomonas aracearum TaxID=2283317 RepID=UPI001EF0E95A|nr:DUF2189 domain-containing protein [Sphingomonas aracearum]